MEVKQSTTKDAGAASARNMHPPREGPVGGGPLSGIKVLDFTRFQNGPSATRALADYGATVIKVENPVGGDELRALFQMRDGYNMAAQFMNRGKKSITLDIRKPEALPIMEKLVKWADVITENFKPGTFDAYGYTYEWCAKINPGIIVCANSGFGNQGPMGHLGSFDAVAQAFTGVMHGQGGGPDQKPQPVDFALSDEVGAMSFVQGILMALLHKARTGEGQRMDTSQVGATIEFQGPLISQVAHLDGRQPDNKYPGFIGPKLIGNQYMCSDAKYMQLQTGNMKNLIRAIGREDMLQDPRTKDAAALRVNDDWVCAELAKTFLTKTREEWLDLIDKTNTGPAGPVQSYKELLEHPQVLANGYAVKVNHNVPGARPQGEVTIGKKFKFSKSPAGPVEKGPEVGEHTEEVLQGMIGVSPAELDKLKDLNIIARGPQKPLRPGIMAVDANDDGDRPAKLGKADQAAVDAANAKGNMAASKL